MLELGIVGAKNSGKTTVIEGLIKYLTNAGYRVATVKHSSHAHRFDTKGKDSDRHRQAGALLTIVRSEKEVAIFAPSESLEIEEIQELTGDKIDIWLIEGDRLADRPRVLVTRKLDSFSGGSTKNILATIGPEQLENVATHFSAGDYSGLGAFICSTMLEKKTESQL